MLGPVLGLVQPRAVPGTWAGTAGHAAPHRQPAFPSGVTVPALLPPTATQNVSQAFPLLSFRLELAKLGMR